MLVVCLAVAAGFGGASSVAAEPSNPAFLGVEMRDLNTGAGYAAQLGPCQIERVTPDTGAFRAGLLSSDIFVNFDGKPVTNCDALVQSVQARDAGELVPIDVLRNGMLKSVDARLMSRADVMRQRVVGQPLPRAELMRVEDQAMGSLSSKGKTTIVGWFDQRCVGCDRVFSTVERWARATSRPSSVISVVGATAGDPRQTLLANLENLKPVQRTYDVPLLVTDADTYSDLALSDPKRITFMVIDARGVVQYAAPLLPDADDRVAVLDELYAATEQAARRVK